MKIKIGHKKSLVKTFDFNTVKHFAEISGDNNPIHLDEEYAINTIFGKCITHGMLVSSMFSNIIGNLLPGPGSIYLSQTLSFKKPVFVGDTVTAFVEVLHIREDKPIFTLKTWCENNAEEIVIDGEALVLYQE